MSYLELKNEATDGNFNLSKVLTQQFKRLSVVCLTSDTTQSKVFQEIK